MNNIIVRMFLLQDFGCFLNIEDTEDVRIEDLWAW